MKYLFTLIAVLAIVGTAFAQTAPSVTIPVTPPAPPPFTVTVSQNATVNGITYKVTGTLTFTPTTGTTTNTWNPSNFGDPLIGGYNADVLTVGDKLSILGVNFGNDAGSVQINSLDQIASLWTDSQIDVPLPLELGNAANRSLIEVRRPDGRYMLTIGPKILPKG